jgi:hypothetical protein
MGHAMSINFGTKVFDILGYTCEFPGSVTAEAIAFDTGMDPHSVRVGISRLRKLGLVLDGSPYRASSRGKTHYEKALAKAGVDL